MAEGCNPKGMKMAEKGMQEKMSGQFKNMGKMTMPMMGGKGPKKSGANKGGRPKIGKGR